MADYPVLERSPAAVALTDCIAALRVAQRLIATPPDRWELEDIARRAERVLASISDVRELVDE